MEEWGKYLQDQEEIENFFWNEGQYQWSLDISISNWVFVYEKFQSIDHNDIYLKTFVLKRRIPRAVTEFIARE